MKLDTETFTARIITLSAVKQALDLDEDRASRLDEQLGDAFSWGDTNMVLVNTKNFVLTLVARVEYDVMTADQMDALTEAFKAQHVEYVDLAA